MTRAVSKIFGSEQTDSVGSIDLDFAEVAACVTIPCSASGTNTLALTPLASTLSVTAYSDQELFSFKAVNNSTGSVTLNVSAIGARNLYLTDGVTQVGSGQIVAGNVYAVQYNTALNSGNGGFVMQTIAALGALSTSQALTSGTGATYTTPANCRQLRVRMIAGGGGGGGAGVSTSPTGGTGGNSNFNAIQAVGGSGGTGGSGTASGNGGAGGSAGTGSAQVRRQGSSGSAGISTASNVLTGSGGTSPFGGAAGGTSSGAGATGAAAATNSGSGGSGCGTAGSTGGSGGGGSGEYVELIINTPAATITYTVGAAGAGGIGTGTGAQTGGAGGSGLILVDEYY